eukprot:994923_1
MSLQLSIAIWRQCIFVSVVTIAIIKAYYILHHNLDPDDVSLYSCMYVLSLLGLFIILVVDVYSLSSQKPFKMYYNIHTNLVALLTFIHIASINTKSISLMLMIEFVLLLVLISIVWSLIWYQNVKKLKEDSKCTCTTYINLTDSIEQLKKEIKEIKMFMKMGSNLEQLEDVKQFVMKRKANAAKELSQLQHLLFEDALEFMKSADDKTHDSEYKLFDSLWHLITTQSTYYYQFVNECDGMEMSLNYMRSKFKTSKTKSALKDLGQPGLDILVRIVNMILEKGTTCANVKLISNNIFFIFDLYLYLHSNAKSECLKFAAQMMQIKEVKQCIAKSYGKAFMERVRRININIDHEMKKMKRVEAPYLDHMMLQCMVLFGNDDDTNKQLASLYHSNEVLYDWMSRYITYYDDSDDVSVHNLHMILCGVRDTVAYADDGAFYLLYNDHENKQNQFGCLMQWMHGVSDLEGFKVGLEIVNALTDKEHGRKYLLQEKDVLYRLCMSMSHALQYKKGTQLTGLVDHVLRKLVQQEQDNYIYNEEEAEVERIEEETRKHAVDWDLDALSRNDGNEAYLKRLRDAEESKEKEKKCFGNKLSMTQIQAILDITADSK